MKEQNNWDAMIPIKARPNEVLNARLNSGMTQNEAVVLKSTAHGLAMESNRLNSVAMTVGDLDTSHGWLLVPSRKTAANKPKWRVTGITIAHESPRQCAGTKSRLVSSFGTMAELY